MLESSNERLERYEEFCKERNNEGFAIDDLIARHENVYRSEDKIAVYVAECASRALRFLLYIDKSSSPILYYMDDRFATMHGLALRPRHTKLHSGNRRVPNMRKVEHHDDELFYAKWLTLANGLKMEIGIPTKVVQIPEEKLKPTEITNIPIIYEPDDEMSLERFDFEVEEPKDGSSVSFVDLDESEQVLLIESAKGDTQKMQDMDQDQNSKRSLEKKMEKKMKMKRKSKTKSERDGAATSHALTKLKVFLKKHYHGVFDFGAVMLVLALYVNGNEPKSRTLLSKKCSKMAEYDFIHEKWKRKFASSDCNLRVQKVIAECNEGANRKRHLGCCGEPNIRNGLRHSCSESGESYHVICIGKRSYDSPTLYWLEPNFFRAISNLLAV